MYSGVGEEAREVQEEVELLRGVSGTKRQSGEGWLSGLVPEYLSALVP